MRNTLLAALALASATAMAATITVTSPNPGDFLGTNNNVSFQISGAVVEVTIDVDASLVSNPAIHVHVQKKFTPDSDGNITGTIPLNFSPSTPEGAYNLAVTATEPGGTYNTPPVVPINVDVKVPKFGDSNPLSGAFVKGVVPIVIDLDEPNVREWRVRINNADIPNNSGDTNLISVDWDSNTIVHDGAQTINVTVDDMASNSASKNIDVTVDRINPSSSILAPTTGTVIRPGSVFAIVVEVQDQFQSSVHWTGIEVRLKDTSNNDLGPVPRRLIKVLGTKVQWTGRIRTTNSLPSTFKIVVTAIDRAGNVAVVQEVTISIGRGRSSNNNSGGHH